MPTETYYLKIIDGGKKRWFDKDMNIIPNPLGHRGYDLRMFYRIVSETRKKHKGKLYNMRMADRFETDNYVYLVDFVED